MSESAVVHSGIEQPPSSQIRWGAHLAFVVPAAICVAAFVWMVSFGTGRLVADDVFGNFYDYQAQAWLHGRWDVPEPSLSGEAFVRDGKIYGYFGPTPALLRIPQVLCGVPFGQTTRLWMTLHYAGALLAAYLLLLEFNRATREQRRGTAANVDAAAEPLRRWLTATYIFSVGLGSTLFFLGSRAYVYHEAILCGANFSLWSTWCGLKYLRSSQRRWPWLAILLGTLAIHARPPIGLFALTFVVAVASWRDIRMRRLAGLAIAAAAIIAVGSFNAVSYIKFRTFEGCPLRLNVQYTPEKLAALGNANFHVANLRFNSAAYLFVPSASIRPEFPFVFLKFIDRKQYPASRMAYRDATLAIPYAMPSLALLALVSLALRRRSPPSSRSAVALLWLSAIPYTLAMLTAVAVTQRYTADFCAMLVPAAAAGTALVATVSARGRRYFGVVAGTATLVAALLQFAITIQHQRVVVWGVPDYVKTEYESWRTAIDDALGFGR